MKDDSADEDRCGYWVATDIKLSDGTIWIRTSAHTPDGALMDGERTVERYDPDYRFWSWMAERGVGFNQSDLPELGAEYEKARGLLHAANPALAGEDAQLGAPGR